MSTNCDICFSSGHKDDDCTAKQLTVSRNTLGEILTFVSQKYDEADAVGDIQRRDAYDIVCAFIEKKIFCFTNSKLKGHFEN